MTYLVETTEHAGTGDRRAELRPAHLRYLDAHKHLLRTAAAKMDEASGTPVGSIYVLDVETRAEAEAWLADEPFAQAGIIAETQVLPLRVAFFDRESLIEIPAVEL